MYVCAHGSLLQPPTVAAARNHCITPPWSADDACTRLLFIYDDYYYIRVGESAPPQGQQNEADRSPEGRHLILDLHLADAAILNDVAELKQEVIDVIKNTNLPLTSIAAHTHASFGPR